MQKRGENQLLGQELGEERGRMIGQRVISVDADRHKVELSIQGKGKILGVEFEDSSTFTIEHVPPFPPSSGQGQGFMTTKDGEVVHYTGQGVGKPTGLGKMRFVGAAIGRTKSEKLARLNGVAMLFEFEADMEKGEYQAKYWEWK